MVAPEAKQRRLEYQRNYARTLRQKRIELGACIRCGKNQAKEGRQSCYECLRAHSEKELARYYDKKRLSPVQPATNGEDPATGHGGESGGLDGGAV